MRQRRYKIYELDTGCGVEACLEIIGGKWKGLLLHQLMSHGTLRFSELQRLKPNLSPRILTAQLRQLEDDGVIVRKIYPVVPPKVEYSLSEAGESLRPLIHAMQKWGDAHLTRTKAPVRSGPVPDSFDHSSSLSRRKVRKGHSVES
jgi:DNA-binding HxlR family transcriptional regulator